MDKLKVKNSWQLSFLVLLLLVVQQTMLCVLAKVVSPDSYKWCSLIISNLFILAGLMIIIKVVVDAQKELGRLKTTQIIKISLVSILIIMAVGAGVDYYIRFRQLNLLTGLMSVNPEIKLTIAQRKSKLDLPFVVSKWFVYSITYVVTWLYGRKNLTSILQKKLTD